MAYDDTPPASPTQQSSTADAVNQSQYVGMDDEASKQAKEQEQNAVKKCMEEYTQGCKFDEGIRSQYAVDRRYAAGTVDPRWAVNTNLIGSFIDILTSFLYARDPEVSVKKSPQVDNRGTRQMDDFAKTMELVITSLWKRARLKTPIRKQVRSALSVGVGWLKVVMIADAPDNPEMQNELNDLRDNVMRLSALREQIAQVPEASTTEIDANLEQQQELMNSLQNRVEVTIRKYLAIDLVAAQDMQVSLDVSTTEDYLDANWCANSTYVLRSEAKAKFPRLSESDIKSAQCYYQRKTREATPMTLDAAVGLGINMASSLSPDEADYYTKGSPGGASSAENGPDFIKVIELWDRRTNHIKTMIEGVKLWAKEPFEPAYPSSRFYPYFRLSFYEVDGARHPQSLSWRLHKLQDEYAASRSNFRLTRQRAIPGLIFNKAGLSVEDANAIQKASEQELIGIMSIDPSTPIQNLFAPKPKADVDMRMYDNQPILSDMEKISGVQEALQSSVGTPKTATEAQIQQTGFASRTTSDRDSLEDMLTDLANYTSEVALGALSTADAQRIAGTAAFWPAGMDINDLLTMVELSIKAGTTGKPNKEASQQAWGVVLPTLKDTMVQIQQAVMQGNIPLAKGLSELIRETMDRMGDDTDPERFLPEIPTESNPLLQLPAQQGAAPVPGNTPTLPQTGKGGDSAPQPPELSAPNVQPPAL